MVDQVKVIQAEDEAEKPYDTADPVQVNTARKKAARTRADRLEFVKAAMTTTQGRAWFYDLLIFAKVFNTPFADDPYRTAFSCGQNNIGLKILSDIQDAAPDHYIDMIKENNRKNG